MNFQTSLTKDNGAWIGRSKLMLSPTLEFEVTTSKNSITGTMDTKARVWKVHPDVPSLRQHAFGSNGDFSQQIEQQSGARATEKAVKEQHERVIGQRDRMETLVSQARSHYVRTGDLPPTEEAGEFLTSSESEGRLQAYEGPAFWSNEDGWIDGPEHATVFTAAESQSMALPLSSLTDARWVNASDAPERSCEQHAERPRG